MATNWVEVAKTVVPAASTFVGVAGVWVGAQLSRRANAQSFMRERIFHEMTKRREVGTQYRKALWAFSARVDTMRQLANEAADAASKGLDISDLKYNLSEA